MSGGARVLIVEDDASVRRILTYNLRGHGYRVEAAQSGEDGLAAVPRFRPDLILLDLGLPGLSGLEVIRRLRERTSTPIIVLSVRGAESDKVQALELGADDYLTKPFGVDELRARVRVALRHAARPRSGTEAVYRAGDLEVDLERRKVRVRGAEVHLTPTEFSLLSALVAQAGTVLTDGALLRRVWGPEYGSENHYLHVYMGRLRTKLEAEPSSPRVIQTEAGVGYRLIEPDAEEDSPVNRSTS